MVRERGANKEECVTYAQHSNNVTDRATDEKGTPHSKTPYSPTSASYVSPLTNGWITVNKPCTEMGRQSEVGTQVQNTP